MSSKIEVDHELFTTCRLCLDKKGNYIIVPDIQKNIKYAYDIEVELNNGLPQLICMNCESILSKYVCTKQMYQEKQKTLQSIPQSTENASMEKTSNINKEPKNIDIPSKNDQHSKTFCSDDGDKNVIIKESVAVSKRSSSWRNNFTEYFACKFCSKTYTKKISVIKHIRKHKTLLLSYQNIATPCCVKLEKIDQKPNITGSKKFVMFDTNKIVQYRKKNYYNVYLQEKKLSCITSSDEDDNIIYPRSKRRRFNSESSEDTVVIEQKDNQNETDVESSAMGFPRKIKDFDSQSTKHDMQPESVKESTNIKSNSIIEHIINLCYTNFLSRIENESSLTDNGKLLDSLLSMEPKILNTSRLNCPALLSYLESKNLDVILNTNSQNGSNIVRIHTKLRGKQYLKKENTWQRLRNASNVDTNFMNILSKALNSEVNNDDKSVSTSTVLAKLLNANPVANPKQLPKKNFVEYNNTVQGSIVNSDNKPGEQDKTKLISVVKQNDVTVESNVSSSTVANNIKEPITYPRIQVKHIDTLRGKNANNDTCYEKNPPFVCYSGRPSSQGFTVVREENVGLPQTSINYASNNPSSVPMYVNIAPAPIAPTINSTPQSHEGSIHTNNNESVSNKKQSQFILLHTVELPNTKTESPFDYFQNLLQMHSIILLDSKAQLPFQSQCLIKFKLKFQQRGAVPVTLAISLFSDVITFSVKVTNSEGVEMDIRCMNANWQWEILKSFRGEIVSVLLQNASKINYMMYEMTSKFVNYLKSIQFRQLV